MNNKSINNLSSVNNLKENSIESNALNNLEKYNSWMRVGDELKNTSELLSNIKYMANELKNLTDNGVIDENSDEYHILKGNLEQARDIFKLPNKSADNIHVFYSSFVQHITIIDILKNNKLNEGDDYNV